MIEKVLVVDDSPIARKIMKKCLPEGRQFQIEEAPDGAAAVEKYKEFNPEIVFLDLTMPVMSGIEALEEIKKIDPKAVVVVATADIQAKTIAQVAKLGALTVLKKPPSAETVLKALEKAEELLDK